MKKSSIYSEQSQELLALFEQAGNQSKLMCIPIDYAKEDHLVMFCNGNGEVLRKPFSVNNSSDGVKYLLDQVKRSCRHRHIHPEHVFFGGEDVNSYAENFANTLRANGCLVANVNAHDAKKQRETSVTIKKRKGGKKLLLQGGLLSLKRGIVNRERNPHVFLQLPFAINIASLAKSIRLVNKNRCFNGK